MGLRLMDRTTYVTPLSMNVSTVPGAANVGLVYGEGGTTVSQAWLGWMPGTSCRQQWYSLDWDKALTNQASLSGSE